jgi:tetratricopeptide (TPR) repeat protein
MTTASDDLLSQGRALCREGNFREGIELFRRVIAADPAHAAAHNFLGMALSRIGEAQQSLPCFDRAIAADANFADALANKADALSALGRFREAIKHYDQALGVDEGNSFGWLNRGVALHAMREFDQALASIDRAVAIDPALALAHANRARALSAMDRNGEALSAIDRAISLEADVAEMHTERGLILAGLGRTEDALASHDRALALLPSSGNHSRRGFALLQMGKASEALATSETALSLDANNADALRLRGLALLALDRSSDALASLDAAQKLMPASAGILHARSAVQLALGNVAAARADADKATSLDPDSNELAAALARIQLLQGEWDKAWANYERRLFTAEAPAVPRHTKYWDGSPLKREQLLLLSEGTAGEIIFSARFPKFFKGTCPRTTLVTAPEFVKLFQSVDGIQESAAAPYRLENDPAFIRYFPLMSSPAAGGFGTARVPNDVPYLSVEPARAGRFAKLIGKEGFRIGIAWQDPPRLRVTGSNAPSLADFAPLAAIPGVRLISLHKEFGSDEIAASSFRDKIEKPLEQIDTEHDFMSDAAAVIGNVDLVVAPDIFAAHLAGALGKPVFTALAVAPNWYWLLEREDSIWYPSMRLFRQEKPGGWADVFSRIAAAAAERKPKAPLPGLGG